MKRIIAAAVFVMITALSVFAAGAPGQPGRPYQVDYWMATAKGGVGYPMGNFGTYVDASYSGGVSIRKGFDVEFSAGGGITYVNLPYKSETPTPFTATIIDLEAVWSPYIQDFFIWPYGKVGIGGYMLKYVKGKINPDTKDTEPVGVSETTIGFMFGGGVNYPIGNMFALNVEGLYNHVSMAGGTGDLNSFLTLCAGVTVFIKNL